jgi:hypothetical protein
VFSVCARALFTIAHAMCMYACVLQLASRKHWRLDPAASRSRVWASRNWCFLGARLKKLAWDARQSSSVWLEFLRLPLGFVGFRTKQSPLFLVVAAGRRQVKSACVLPTCRTGNSFSSGSLDATTTSPLPPGERATNLNYLSFVKLYCTRE